MYCKWSSEHLYNHLRDNNVLSYLQSGFIQGDSTVNQLIFLYNTFCQALDIGKEVRVVFCDIGKAFDPVWHAGLIHKLKAAGVQGELLKWFTNYLAERKQRIILPGVASDWTYILAGVTQGSILGPTLFLIYINDISSNMRLFADDTSLYIFVENPITSTVCLLRPFKNFCLGKQLVSRLQSDKNRIKIDISKTKQACSPIPVYATRTNNWNILT